MLGQDELTKPLKVIKKELETPDCYTITLEVPAEHKKQFHYKAGQFVTLFLNINGEEIRRSYSLSSSPDTDNEFYFTVKKVLGGKVSTYLCDELNVGDTLFVTPPAGRFILPDYLQDRTFIFFAAGSGITPIFSLIKSLLIKSSTTKCILLYASRNESSIIFHRQLKALESKYPERFQLEYVLSSPQKEWDGKTGRVSGPMIVDFLDTHSVPNSSLAYLCGPEGFMATCQTSLELHGFLDSAIIKESFATAVHTKDFSDELGEHVVYVGDQHALARPETVTVELGGETIEFVPKDGVSILETLLEDGHNPPYSCMNGSCMACLGKVREGLIYQNDMGILTDDNINAKECLTCQAFPASKKVRISYDF